MIYLCAFLLVLLCPSYVLALPATPDPRFANVRTTPHKTPTNAPRVVRNMITAAHNDYTAANWGESLAGSGSLQWGHPTDGGQWVSATTTGGATDRAYTVATFTGLVGERWIASFTVDSKTGTLAGDNVTLGTCVSGVSSMNNPALGRNAIVVTLTTGGSCVMRFGNGTSSANPNASTIRISNIQLEKASTSRSYPYEYTRPGDQRAFPYTYTASLSGGTTGLVQNIVQGTTFTVHYRHSVLVIGDSICNDVTLFGIGGDFPSHAMRLLELAKKEYAVVTRCVSGSQLDANLTHLDSAFAEPVYSAGVLPWTTVVIEGGINDVSSFVTLAQLKARLLALNAQVRSYGARPVFMTIGPWNAATGAQQTIITAYNTWIKTLGVPVIDANYICNAGNDTFAAKCNAADGLHPGTALHEGGHWRGAALADILQLLP